MFTTHACCHIMWVKVMTVPRAISTLQNWGPECEEAKRMQVALHHNPPPRPANHEHTYKVSYHRDHVYLFDATGGRRSGDTTASSDPAVTAYSMPPAPAADLDTTPSASWIPPKSLSPSSADGARADGEGGGRGERRDGGQGSGWKWRGKRSWEGCVRSRSEVPSRRDR